MEPCRLTRLAVTYDGVDATAEFASLVAGTEAGGATAMPATIEGAIRSGQRATDRSARYC